MTLVPPPWVSSSTEMLFGQVMSVGGALSTTLTVKAFIVLFEPSLTVQLTVWVPTAKIEPEAGLHETAGDMLQLSAAAGGV